MARRKAGSGSGEDVAVGELYLGDFEGFVGRRSELAKQLRARGDGEGADRVRALKKPGRVAWAINQLSGDDATVRDELLGAGAALREAHETLRDAGSPRCGRTRSIGTRSHDASLVLSLRGDPIAIGHPQGGARAPPPRLIGVGRARNPMARRAPPASSRSSLPKRVRF